MEKSAAVMAALFFMVYCHLEKAILPNTSKTAQGMI